MPPITLFVDFYVQATFIIGHIEVASFKTAHQRSKNNTVKFDQSTKVNIPAKDIKNLSILIELYEKRIVGIKLTSTSYGRVVIGPYMAPMKEDGGISVWEKMIVYPNQLFTSINSLHH